MGRGSAGARDSVTVLEVSLERNLAELVEWLDKGVEIFYIGYHSSGEIPPHPGLTTKVDTIPETCANSLMNRQLGGSARNPLLQVH